MAKKKTTGTTPPSTDSADAAPARRRTSRRAVPPEPPPAPLDLASVTRAESPEAADMQPIRTEASGATATHRPTYEEIAEVAYQRYLRRGGGDGADLDDWLDAERELRSRDR